MIPPVLYKMLLIALQFAVRQRLIWRRCLNVGRAQKPRTRVSSGWVPGRPPARLRHQGADGRARRGPRGRGCLCPAPLPLHICDCRYQKPRSWWGWEASLTQPASSKTNTGVLEEWADADRE